jgi:hypothetical protein
MLFICGREQDITRGERATVNQEKHSQMENAHAVYISDQHVWILVAAFFRGGVPEAFNPELLFPAKTARVLSGHPGVTGKQTANSTMKNARQKPLAEDEDEEL